MEGSVLPVKRAACESGCSILAIMLDRTNQVS